MEDGLDKISSEGSGEDCVGAVIFEERRASVRAIIVTLTIWFAVIFVSSAIIWVRINGSLALLLTLLLLLFPLFSFISWVMFRMFIDAEKIQVVRTFIYRNKESLEFNKIEGVDIQQGPFGRAFDYGRLTIFPVLELSSFGQNPLIIPIRWRERSAH